jgi:hypothetical protein
MNSPLTFTTVFISPRLITPAFKFIVPKFKAGVKNILAKSLGTTVIDASLKVVFFVGSAL